MIAQRFYVAERTGQATNFEGVSCSCTGACFEGGKASGSAPRNETNKTVQQGYVSRLDKINILAIISQILILKTIGKRARKFRSLRLG